MSAVLPMSPNLESCQPRLTASLRPGFVRLCCERNGAPAVRLQTRLRGEAWHTLADGVESTHVEDHTPVAVAGCEEVRDYRAIAVWQGEEVGHPSEIVTVTVPA